jgi:hypothetical protein
VRSPKTTIKKASATVIRPCATTQAYCTIPDRRIEISVVLADDPDDEG